jgi:hypothetical protein
MSDSTAAPSNPVPLPYSLDYPPPDFVDPVVEVYKKDVDRTIIRENLKLTVEERLRKYQSFLKSREAWKGAATRVSIEPPQTMGTQT